MLCFCVVLFFTHTSWSSEVSGEQNRNAISSRVNSYELPRINRSVAETNQQKPTSENEESIASWENFTLSLTEATLLQLEDVQQNIKASYRLTASDIKEIDKSFNTAAKKYMQMVKNNLENLVNSGHFNKSLDFMIDFVDISNVVLQKTLELALANVGGSLLLPTKWYRQSMKQKILRQQSKIATNYVESHMCFKLSVCKDRITYTQYLSEWVRRFLGFSAIDLKKLFLVIPDILSLNVHTIKSTTKFKKTVKYIVNSDDVVQRDTLDYIDEVITAQSNVQNILPTSMKKGAVLLTELFHYIDANYDLNDDNAEQLDNVSKLLTEWEKGGIDNIKLILESILKNLVLNLKIWSLEVQNKIELVWYQIISL